MRANSEKLHVGQYRLTEHANCRLQQRGLSRRQIELVMAHGVPVDDGYVMTKSAADQRIAELKQEMKLIERLNNVTVIDLHGTIATVYRVSDRRIRRMRGK